MLWVVALLAIGLATVPAVAAAPAAASSGRLQGNGSVDEAWLTGASPGDVLTLEQNGSPVANPANPGTADALGSLVVRNLTPGAGYQWQDTTKGTLTPAFSVLAPGANPGTGSALYTGQSMQSGLNYITMRDGIQLAATVRFPYGTSCSATAPCPTVIEYSGYNVAGPTDPIPFLVSSVLGTPCTGCGDTNLLPDSATDVGAVVARLSGFATVSLQMRGTGCSGGALDLFGYPSDYDAYDAIEIVAHQSWVAKHKVGMVGISFSGLSQIPSAGTDPPGLAAIASLSPTDDLFSTGYPGGIFNNGFAASWVSQRAGDAKAAASWSAGTLVPLAAAPVAGVGQPWTYYEIDDELAATGSSRCLADQALHGQSESLSALVGQDMVTPSSGGDRDPSLFDRRSMRVWASKVTVPVFVSGALEDEQTGPQWPALIDAFPSSTPVFANMVNGGHIDSGDPETMSRWYEFLEIYVAKKVPHDPGSFADQALDQFASLASGTTAQAPLPAFRFTTDKTAAKAASDFAASTPRVQVLFDSGAGSVGAGDPQSTYQSGFATWPPAGKVRTYFFGPHASLSTTAPSAASQASFTLDPSVHSGTDLASGSPWAASPDWTWNPVPAADALGFETAPFTKTTTIVGPASVDLWVRSPSAVEDYQVTVTEVRPQTGQEEYVTSGFLRSDNTVDLADSTPLFTDPSYLQSDETALSATGYSLVRIPIDPIAHTFRRGTELRIVISAPGGDRPAWTFATLDAGDTAQVGMGGAVASALVVNQVGGVHSTTALPTCGTLRGEPCRNFQGAANGP